MLSNEKINLSKTRLKTAKERIAFADKILEIGDYKTVANRSYYAVFSAMRAVLALDGFDSKMHSGIIAEFRKNYLKTEVLSKELSQESAIDYVLKEINETNKNISLFDDNQTKLYEYLKSKEKADLYTISTPDDIAELEDDEKLFLVEILSSLALDDVPNKYQQTFISSVMQYLDIKEPGLNENFDITHVAYVDSIRSQKAIYQVVLEYLTLQDGEFIDKTDFQNLLINSFSFKENIKKSVEERVAKLFQIVGENGFVEKYGYVVEPEPVIEEQNNNITEEQKREQEISQAINLRIATFINLEKVNGTKKRDITFEQMKKIKNEFRLSAFEASEENIIGWYDSRPFNLLTGQVSGILFLKDRFIHKQTPHAKPVSLKYSQINYVKQTFRTLVIKHKNGGETIFYGVSSASNNMYSLFKDITKIYNS